MRKQTFLAIIAIFLFFAIGTTFSTWLYHRRGYPTEIAVPGHLTLKPILGLTTEFISADRHGIIYKVTNGTNHYVALNEFTVLQVLKNDVWYDLKAQQDYNKRSESVYIDKTITIEYNWNIRYGKLKRGRYRLIRGVSSGAGPSYGNISFEFTIN